MRTYDLFDDDFYVGHIVCESVTIEDIGAYNRYVFRQGAYSTIIRNINNLRIEEDLK